MTISELDTAVEAMTYSNSDQSPTIGSTRVVTITTLTDEGSSSSPHDNSATESDAATVTLTKSNDAPVSAATADQTAYEDVPFTVDLATSSDVDGDSLSHTCVETGEGSLPMGLSETGGSDTGGTAELAGTGLSAHLSGVLVDTVFSITCTLSDGTASDTDVFTITLVAVNDAPALTSAASSVAQGSAIDITVTASDEESVDVEFALTSKPSWLTFADNGNGASTMDLDAAANQVTDARVGDHDVVVTISDGVNTQFVIYIITITEVNDESTFSTTGANPTFTEGDSSVTLFSSTSVADGDANVVQTFATLTFTITNVQDTTEQIYMDGGWINLAAMGSTSTTTSNSYTYQITGCATTCTVALSGMSLTATQMNTLVDGLKYRNTDDSPTDADRVVDLTAMTDSGSTGGSHDASVDPATTSTINGELLNDAPDGGAASLTNVAEDVTNPAGDSVNDILSSTPTDADAGSDINGVLICAYTHDANKGTWAYDNGDGSWVTISTRSDTSNCLGVEDDDDLRFLPAANYNGAATTLNIIAVDNSQAIQRVLLLTTLRLGEDPQHSQTTICQSVTR
jgi:hypothetical protein